MRNLLIIPLFVFCLLRISGQETPFDSGRRIGLGYLAIDGGLDLRLPLLRATTRWGFSLNARLEHQMIDLGYKMVKSNFVLRPFVTSIGLRGRTFYWEAPSGTEYRFAPEGIAAVTLSPDNTRFNNLQFGEKYHLRQLHGIRIIHDSAYAWCLVQQAGYELLYREGSLYGIQTPQGNEIQVVATGRFITRMSDTNGFEIVVDWNEGQPISLKTIGRTFVFTSEGGRLTKLQSQESGSLGFHYSAQNNLIERLTHGQVQVRFSWAPVDDYSHGDSSYAKPYTLAGVGDTKYIYEIDGSNIILRQRAAGQPEKRIDISTEGGKLTVANPSEPAH